MANVYQDDGCVFRPYPLYLSSTLQTENRSFEDFLRLIKKCSQYNHKIKMSLQCIFLKTFKKLGKRRIKNYSKHLVLKKISSKVVLRILMKKVRLKMRNHRKLKRILIKISNFMITKKYKNILRKIIIDKRKTSLLFYSKVAKMK